MLQRVTLRASIWERSGMQWRMRFHQGAPAAASVASLDPLSQCLPPGGCSRNGRHVMPECLQDRWKH